MERGPPEDVDRGVGRGLGEADLAGARPGGERLGLDARSGRRSTTRTCGRQAPPWQVPMPASVARLSSSSSVYPAAHASLEVRDRDAHAAADDGRRVGRRRRSVAGRSRRRRRPRPGRSARPSGPARPAARRPRSTIDGPCRDGRLRRRPRRASRRPRTRPAASPSKRTGGRSHGHDGLGQAPRPAGAQPLGGPCRSGSRSRSLPGQTGWISAAPVATTISSASTWSTPDGVRADDGRSRVDADDLDRRRRRRGPARPSALARGRRPARPAADRRRSRRPVARPGPSGPHSRRRGAAGSRPPDAARRPRPARRPSGRSGRRRRRRRPRGSSRSRPPGRGSRRVPASSPARRIATASESPARASIARPSTTIRAGSAARRLGHWRIRTPWGSNSGSGWSRAGRRRPMISISKRAAVGRPATPGRPARTRARCDALTWWP